MSIMHISLQRRHFLASGAALAAFGAFPSLARADATLDRIKQTGAVSVGDRQ